MNFLSSLAGWNASNSPERTLTYAFPIAGSIHLLLLKWKILALQLTFLMKNELKREENALAHSMTPTFLSFFSCWIMDASFFLSSFVMDQLFCLIIFYLFWYWEVILYFRFFDQNLTCWSVSLYISWVISVSILLVFIFFWLILQRSWIFHTNLLHFLFFSSIEPLGYCAFNI